MPIIPSSINGVILEFSPNVLLTLTILLTACSNHADKMVKNLHNAMAYGTIKELNELTSDKNQDLLVRLYQTPQPGSDCFIETHGVCKYKYFISASTFDEYPDANVYELKNTGEIISIEWIEENKHDYSELKLKIQKYTQQALNNNPALKNSEMTVLLKLSPKQIIEKSLSSETPTE